MWLLSVPATLAFPAPFIWPRNTASRRPSWRPTRWPGAVRPATAARRRSRPAPQAVRVDPALGRRRGQEDACNEVVRGLRCLSRPDRRRATSTATRRKAATTTSRTNPAVMPKAGERRSALLNDVFGYGSRIISRDELHEAITSRTRKPPAPCTSRTAPASMPPNSPSAISAGPQAGRHRSTRQARSWAGRSSNGVHHLTTPGGTVQGARRGARHRRLHAAGSQQPDQEPADADPVQFDRHPAARAMARRKPAVSRPAPRSPIPARSATTTASARRPGADRQPQRDHRKRCREPKAPGAAAGKALPQVSGVAGHQPRLFLVGLGRRQPRYDAAHFSPTPSQQSSTPWAMAATG